MTRDRTGRGDSPTVAFGRGRRGQLVLLSGVVVALALLAMLTAFLQLGYHGDVATGGDERRVTDAGAYLERVTHDAARDLRGEYIWAERDGAVRALEGRLRPALATLERARAESGVAATATRNHTAGARWAAANCPAGSGRDFGPCRAERGVVVQERDGRTLVLAVAYDLTVATEDATTRVTTVVEPVG